MKTTTITLSEGCQITVAVADTFFLRLRGLIGRDVQAIGGLLIRPCNQIHTCFMGYPIDVLYLDAQNKIVRIDEAVPAGRFCKAERGAVCVVELAAGRVSELKKRCSVHQGMTLHLSEN